VALALAQSLGGEIIAVDSMQLYRGLDIGTAKPSPEDRARVRHHLIDVVELTDTFDAAKFVELGRTALVDISARGRVPILCGGTGLYFKALMHGLGPAPPADPAVRAELQATPLPELLRQLSEKDPLCFAKIDRQNPRRVIRALEVIRLTGKPFSTQRADWSHTPENPEKLRHAFCLTRAPQELRRRIEARVDQMFRCGLVDETEALLKCGLAENPTAMQALGYRQVIEYLRGQRSLSQTIALVKIRTCQFAKRQLTWFRRQMALNWIKVEPSESLEDMVERLALAMAGKQ
jgi:tRNA dimethylallyltransferase